MKKIYLFILTLLLCVTVVSILYSSRIVKDILPLYLSKIYKIDVRIDRVSFKNPGCIIIGGLRLSNRKGLQCNIQDAAISYDIVSIIRQDASFNFRFEKVELSYPSSVIINGIANLLSIKPSDLGKFDYIKGSIYHRKQDIIIKDLDATAKLLRAFISGNIIAGSKIDCTFEIQLSPELVAGIPETTRRTFFKQGDFWSGVKLYISGDLNRPSINFSTDLFKLIIRR